MPTIDKCATTTCGFNHDGCAAPAMTMGGSGCVTFIQLGVRGGLDRVSGHVGACQRADCTFNHDLVCGADLVKIGADDAECLTFAAK